jgi:Tol biopolymer transport system component
MRFTRSNFDGGHAARAMTAALTVVAVVAALTATGGLAAPAATTAAAGVVLSMSTSGAAAGSDVQRMSVSSLGRQGNGGSGSSAASGDGRYVVFLSDATNLVRGDTNGFTDVFVRDRRGHRTVRVSVARDGAQAADGPASFPGISADGRYVTYTSTATNLVPGDTNDAGDVFVRDLRTGSVVRAGLSNAGTQGNSWSSSSVISADGRYVAFISGSSNLVPGDTNGTFDVFVRDLRTGTTRRANVSTAGEQSTGPGLVSAISGDGRFVTWFTDAPGLVPEDTDALVDVFLRDLRRGTTERISQSYTGAPPNGHSLPSAISHDGRYVAFSSSATNLVAGDDNQAEDVFIRDRRTATTRIVSVRSTGAQANGASTTVAISPEGRYVLFGSQASDLVPGDTNDADDVFLHDRRTGTTKRVSVAGNGSQANGFSSGTQVGARGRYVLFDSSATNLVRGDTNEQRDVFIRIRAS